MYGDSKPADSPLDLQGVVILVVDNDPNLRELIVFLLEQSGAQVVGVSSATEALDFLAQVLPDVLLSHIAMPDMDGYTLLQQVRALLSESGTRIPAIAMTADSRQEYQQQILAAGFQAYMQKPFEREELVKTIVNLLESR